MISTIKYMNHVIETNENDLVTLTTENFQKPYFLEMNGIRN